MIEDRLLDGVHGAGGHGRYRQGQLLRDLCDEDVHEEERGELDEPLDNQPPLLYNLSVSTLFSGILEFSGTLAQAVVRQ